MNQYTLDGVPLRDPKLRWHSDRGTGIRILPARRQPEQRFPMVDGVNFIPRAPYDPGAVAIQLQVTGDSYRDFRENLEFIMALIGQRNKLMPLVDHYDEANPINDRVAMVTLSSSVDPVMIDRQTARVGAVFSVPGTFWRSSNVQTGATTAVATTGSTFELKALEGGNAPIDDMMIRVRGAFSSLTIKDPVTLRSLSVDTALSANETLLIDPVAWRASIISGTSNTWNANQGKNISGYVNSNRGQGSMFAVEPSLDTTRTKFIYQISASAQNILANPIIEYQAKKSFL